VLGNSIAKLLHGVVEMAADSTPRRENVASTGQKTVLCLLPVGDRYRRIASATSPHPPPRRPHLDREAIIDDTACDLRIVSKKVRLNRDGSLSVSPPAPRRRLAVTSAAKCGFVL
jgi:hypothetical protein